jgi:hypothetical protein
MKITNEQSDLIIQMNKEFKTSDEISTVLNIDKKAIIKHLKNLKVKNITSRNFYNAQINHNYFDNIDTPEKAYILGLLASDGNLNRFRVRLRIHPKDRELVDFVAKEVNYLKDSKISKNSYNTEQIELGFTSVQMCNSLFKLGFSHNKTYSDLFIDLGELTRFYLLGLFDGDGSIFYTKFDRKTGSRAGETIERYGFSYTGNTITGNNVRDYLQKQNINLNIQSLKKNPKICSVNLNRNREFGRLYNYLYEGHNLGLKRKRDKFKEAFDFYNRCSTTTIGKS